MAVIPRRCRSCMQAAVRALPKYRWGNTSTGSVYTKNEKDRIKIQTTVHETRLTLQHHPYPSHSSILLDKYPTTRTCTFTLHYLIFLVWRWNRYINIKLEIWHAYNIPGWSWSWRGRDVGIFLGASGLGWRGGEGLLPLGYTALGIVVENGQTRLKGIEIQLQIYQNQCVMSFYYLYMKKKSPIFFFFFFLSFC